MLRTHRSPLLVIFISTHTEDEKWGERKVGEGNGQIKLTVHYIK